MIKKYLLVVSSMLVILLLGAPSLASAHVLVTDQSIGAVLHIDPDDNPIAGRVTTLYLEFEDKTSKLSLYHCACTFSIIEDGKVLTSQPLAVKSDSVGSAAFTFPKRDVYTFEVAGDPQADYAPFQHFKIDYTIRVDRDDLVNSSGAEPGAMKISFLLGNTLMGLFLLALCYTLIGRIERKRSAHKHRTNRS